MENDVLNVPPPDGKKFTVRKVLPVVWLVLCTALIVQFLRICISNLIVFNNLGSSSNISWAVSIYTAMLVSCIIIYASVAVMLIPKIIAAFRPSKPLRVTDYTTLAKKILLIAWAISFIVALIWLLGFTIWSLDSYVEVLPTYTDRYETYKSLVTEIIYMIVYIVMLAVLYAPVIVLFVLKIRAAFMPRKKEDNV